MEEIIIDSVTISQINESLEKASNAVAAQNYTEAGIETRKACEVFTTAILESFLRNDLVKNYSSLDEKIKGIRDNKCMERKEIDVLFDAKSYGNNVAHINKSIYFNPRTIVELLPSFTKLVNDYLSNINEKYDAYLSRFELGEAELFERFDSYIKASLQTYVLAWKKAYEENGLTKSLYIGATILPKEYINDEDRQAIKKNLYNATKILMDIVCKFNRVNVEDSDYLTLMEKLEKIQQYNRKQRNYNNRLEYNYPVPVDVEIKKYSNKKEASRKNKVLYSSLSCEIAEISSESDYQPFSYVLSCNYEPKSYPLPIAVIRSLGEDYKYRMFKSDFESLTFEQSFFADIRNICEDSFYNGDGWDERIYGYIRMVHQVAENLKAEHDTKYSQNPMSELIQELDNIVIAEENAALE